MSKAIQTDGWLESLKEKVRSAVVINEDDLSAIANRFECRFIKKDRFLLQEGNPCNFWGFVHSGLLRIYSHKSTGEEYTNWFMKEGEFFSEFVSFFKQVPSLENLVALEDATVVTVTANDLLLLIDRFPAFEKFVRLMYQQSIVNIKEGIQYKIRLNAQERYLRFIQTQPELVRRVPLKYIASYIDVTESTLSRIRRKIMSKAVA